MKKFILSLMFVLCFVSISSAVTLDNRSFEVIFNDEAYYAYFDKTSPIFEPEETGVCYFSSYNMVLMIFNYWYKEGEVLRLHGFSDFLVGPTKLTQIIYGFELNEVYPLKY